MVFILNLVIILLIIICFVLHCFFIDFFFFFTFHNSICDWLGSLFFYFFRFTFNEITQPHDLGHRFERLARVNFYLFLKYFFSNIFFLVFFFDLLFTGSSHFHVMYLICSPELTARFTRGFFFILFFICFHHIGGCPFFIFSWLVRPFIIFFYGVSLFNHFRLYLLFKPWVFYGRFIFYLFK